MGPPPVPVDHCRGSDYGVLYNGYANKILGATNERSQTVYSITTTNMILSLTSTGTYTTCGHTLIRTEHPKLIVFETTFGAEVFKSSGFIAVNMDIFTYVNSKFVYVERHVRTQINQLYRNIS